MAGDNKHTPAARSFWTGALLLAAMTVLYVATYARVLSITHDAPHYLNLIESGRFDFHHHHLLYQPLNVIALNFLRLIDPSIDAVFAISALNGIFGALNVFAVFRIARDRLEMTATGSLSVALATGTSFGLWLYSGTVEVYVIPLCLLSLSFYLLSAPNLSRRRMAVAGLLSGLAVLFHQVHVLFGAAAILRLLLDLRGGAAAAIRAFVIYGTCATVVAVGGYAAVIIGSGHAESLEAVWLWLTNYAQKDAYWHALEPRTFLLALIGLGRAIIGGHFMLALPEVSHALQTAMPGKGFDEETFLVRNVAPAEAYLLTAFVLAAGGVVLALLFNAARGIGRLRGNRRRTVGLLIAWLVPYCGFFLFWEPNNSEFWLPQSEVLWLLLFGLQSRQSTVVQEESRTSVDMVLPWCAVLLIALVNYFGSIRHAMDSGNDYYLWKLGPMIAETSDNDLIVVDEFWLAGPYLARYTKAVVVSRKDYDPARIDQLSASTLAAGGRVFILDGTDREQAMAAPPSDGKSRLLPAVGNGPQAYWSVE